MSSNTSSSIDALYIFDNLSPIPLLQYEWRRQSTTSHELITAYNSTPAPRPSLIHITHTSPPTLLFSITHNNLIFLVPSTTEIEPLLVLEFLHRVVDVLEDYFSPPLLPAKIENNYDVVAQLLAEMCDDGNPFTTEPNALRDLVVPPSLMGKIFGSVTGLPNTHLSSQSSAAASSSATTLSAIPWRRSNVKHTNNELYVDIIEVITATFAPSGRPLTARAAGTIAITCKISGIPDLLLTLGTPGGGYGRKLSSSVELPVFHPCVRIAHWRDKPGELSFVPPDGKFVLASYEVDLLPNPTFDPSKTPQLALPVSVEIRKGLGELANEFEVRVFVNPSVAHSTPAPSSSARSLGSSPVPGRNSPAPGGGASGAFGGGAFGGTSKDPAVEDVVITIPLPSAVKTLVNTRTSKGDWHHERNQVTWKIPLSASNGNASSMNGGGMTATFRTGLVLKPSFDGDDSDDENDSDDGVGSSASSDRGATEYDEDPAETRRRRVERVQKARTALSERRKARLAGAMPRAVLVGFAVKGWLVSGVRVDGLRIVSVKGLSESVKPYKGVKYLTKAGSVEVRC